MLMPQPRHALSTPLTSVQFALTAHASDDHCDGVVHDDTSQFVSARKQVGTLPHVVAIVSECLDVAHPHIWSLPHACEKNLLHLAKRVGARVLATDTDPHYWRYQCSKALAFVVQHDNDEMLEWLHDYCPRVLPYSSMIEAAKQGNLRVLQWLVDHHDDAPWVPQLMDAAASGGHVEVLEWLHAHPKNVGCTLDALSPAVLCGHVETIKWLLYNYGDVVDVSEYDVTHAITRGHSDVVKLLYELNRLAASDVVAAAARVGDLELIQWLNSQQISKQTSVVPQLRMIFTPIELAALGGHLHVLKWLLAHNRHELAASTMNIAAQNGHLEVVQWLHNHHPEGCTTAAIGDAAARGHLNVAKWLHANRSDDCTVYAMNQAARSGYLEVVQWLHANRSEGCTTWAMDSAAVGGHLEVVKWLHEHRAEGCTTDAMNGAAADGHLEAVQWLHANRFEGCTTAAMDNAATNGHLKIVQWLHASRTEGCTTAAMDAAAANGHLDVVKWLHEHRTEGCTTRAMDDAAQNGHLEVVKWLHERRTEGCTREAMRLAAEKGHFDVLLFLHAHRSEGCGRNTVPYATGRLENLEITQWLAEKYPYSLNRKRFRSGDTYMPALLKYVLHRESDTRT